MSAVYDSHSSFNPSMVGDVWIERLAELDRFVVRELGAYALFRSIATHMGVAEEQISDFEDEQLGKVVTTFYKHVELLEPGLPCAWLDEEYDLKPAYSSTSSEIENDKPERIKHNVTPRLRVTPNSLHPDDLHEDELESFERWMLPQIDDLVKGELPPRSTKWFAGIILTDSDEKSEFLIEQRLYIDWLVKTAECLELSIPYDLI